MKNISTSLAMLIVAFINTYGQHEVKNHEVRSTDFEITLKNGTDKEQKAKEQLVKIIEINYDKIKDWLYTKTIAIDEKELPHSHPLLTLNTNYLNNDLKQLATFLHEEFHWLESDLPNQREKAIDEFRQLFPNAPDRKGGGARSSYSSYLHLIVCDLELQAMSKVIGDEKARQIISEWTHYSWVYDKVLNDNRIRQVNTKYGFVVQ